MTENDPAGGFPTTHWTRVARADDAHWKNAAYLDTLASAETDDFAVAVNCQTKAID